MLLYKDNTIVYDFMYRTSSYNQYLLNYNIITTIVERKTVLIVWNVIIYFRYVWIAMVKIYEGA